MLLIKNCEPSIAKRQWTEFHRFDSGRFFFRTQPHLCIVAACDMTGTRSLEFVGTFESLFSLNISVGFREWKKSSRHSGLPEKICFGHVQKNPSPPIQAWWFYFGTADICSCVFSQHQKKSKSSKPPPMFILLLTVSVRYVQTDQKSRPRKWCFFFFPTICSNSDDILFFELYTKYPKVRSFCESYYSNCVRDIVSYNNDSNIALI